MFLFQIDSGKILSQKKEMTFNPIDNSESTLLKSLSSGVQVDDFVWLPPNTQIDPALLFGKILDLSNEYIIYALTHQNKQGELSPWEKSNELYEILDEYTAIPTSDKGVNAVKDFFASIMNGKAIDPNNDGKYDQNDVLALWENSQEGSFLPMIEALSKGLSEDPNSHLSDIPKLGKLLAKYTGTKYESGDAKILSDWFLTYKKDLTGDGQVDHQDTIAFWSGFKKPPPPWVIGR